MRLKQLNVRLFRLPADVEVILFHIREALKARKLFNNLSEAGFDESSFHSDFSDFVLAAMGFEEGQEDLHLWYFDLIDKHSRKTSTDNDKCTRAALRIYVDLVNEKRRRLKKRP